MSTAAAVVRRCPLSPAPLLLGALALFMLVFVAFPLGGLTLKSFQDRSGLWVGFANYLAFAQSPALGRAVVNSLTVSAVTTAITIALAFPFAFALTRSRMPGREALRILAQIPILAPSLLPALSLVYLFGNKGILKAVMMGQPLYGPIGIVMAEVFYTFPHALMILVTALSVSDARLYEAAESLGAGPLRRFFSITLPGARYGLISALFVVFTLVITDFGVPKVVGGQYSVMATEVYKQVIGQQNFGIGAVVGLVLMLPAGLAFAAESWGAKKQKALLSSRSVPYRPAGKPFIDWSLFAFASLVILLLAGVLGMAGYASFVKFWPYDVGLTLANYDFSQYDGAGWSSYWNAIEMSLATAVFGTVLIFSGAYTMEKMQGPGWLKSSIRLLMILPLAVPGMVLGLSYIFFFNHPDNPLNILYHGMAILVLSTVVHFYTVSHLTAVTALKQLDAEFEAVTASLKVPLWKTFLLVTVPLCLPAILDILIYLFVNAMTTVSAVVFLYAPDTKTASVAVLNMDDAGEMAGAAAMAMMIVYTSSIVRLGHAGLETLLRHRTQRWRERS
ncbi:MAG TPA: putative 2-aminoethylphosphonate ABC transporter permease subunit [Candidatus Sulfotelmatobacter sp.]|jgi:iron(III) transport system permease protein|nr:putative 2-aminoethylphosphonate ABC transporter permease subunit [Candidatus Sulfotelmatobacter sp.]